MDAKTYLDKYGKEKAKTVAEGAGTTIEYFQQIASGNRRPSVKLTKKLIESSENELDFVSLLTAKEKQMQEAA